MTDPRLISIVSTIFALMGSYSLYTGSRRLRDMRRAGQPGRWYKQISFLTGVEYILLTFVFLLTLVNRQTKGPVTGITIPLYFIFLICAAIVAGLVIRQGLLDIRGSRSRRAQTIQATQPIQTVQTPIALEATNYVHTKDDDEIQARRQRERRKNAAAARRRRAGKA